MTVIATHTTSAPREWQVGDVFVHDGYYRQIMKHEDKYGTSDLSGYWGAAPRFGSIKFLMELYRGAELLPNAALVTDSTRHTTGIH